MFCIDELSLLIVNSLRFGIFSTGVPVLVYYSHLTAIVLSLLLSFFVFIKNKSFLPSRILLALSSVFSILAILDIFLWILIDSSWLMFLWSFWIFLFITIFFLAAYFLYVYIKEVDVPFLAKALSSLLLVAVLILSSTNLNLEFFDTYNCSASEGTLVLNLIFGFSLLIFFAIITFASVTIRKIIDPIKRKGATLATLGISFFLFAFAGTAYYASIVNLLGGAPDTFTLEQYGYFGMTVFVGFLAYIIVRYKAFNVKLIATQALVVSLFLLIGFQFFFIRNPVSQVLNIFTLALSLGFGFLLVRSVKYEISLREELELANKRQQGTMRFITHEVKGYLTDGAAALDALRTGSFGPVTSDMREMIGEALVKNRAAVREIQNFLRIADFKTGKVAYAMKQFDFKKILDDALVTPTENAKTKGLTFTLDIAPADYTMVGDGDQVLNHVIVNLVNNAINYTPTGDVTIRLERTGDLMRFSVKDSGVGLTEDDKKVLFTEGGHGKESRAVNPHSTGYGLFIAKQIVDAHHGRMWAESAGRGTGATFFVELPTNLRPTLSTLVQK